MCNIYGGPIILRLIWICLKLNGKIYFQTVDRNTNKIIFCTYIINNGVY